KSVLSGNRVCPPLQGKPGSPSPVSLPLITATDAYQGRHAVDVSQLPACAASLQTQAQPLGLTFNHTATDRTTARQPFRIIQTPCVTVPVSVQHDGKARELKVKPRAGLQRLLPARSAIKSLPDAHIERGHQEEP